MAEVDADRVEQIIRSVAATKIVSRHGVLKPEEIGRKSADDLVTAADREAEAELSRALTRVLPGSVAVGEEAVFERPDLLGTFAGTAPIWVIDPLDGTANFVRGSRDFSTMVALVQGGATRAAWIHAPLLDLTVVAVEGKGVRLDGSRLTPPALPSDASPVLRIATTHPDFRGDIDRQLLAPLDGSEHMLRPSRGAGLEYVALARGDIDATVFTWEKPWDHLPGLFVLQETDCVSETLSGRKFDPAGGNDLPLVSARQRMDLIGLQALLARRA